MTATSIAIVSPSLEPAKVVPLLPVHPEPVAPPFRGLSHREAIELELPAVPHLIRGAAERGSVGTLAGLPESFKSFLAMEIAFKVAGGGASVLDLEVETHGPVGYWWQDDSKEAELGRLKAYATRHGYIGELPIRWHLNENLRLPDHVAALRAEIEREGQVFVVLDSLYNFLPPQIKLKDEEVAQVLDVVKSSICDPTGCAVAFVDHAPWPSDSNRGQVRGYGSVFKAAAIRWGVYLERKKGSGEVWIEARGNNVAGFRRKQFVWDADGLEFRPVDRQQLAADDLDQRICEYVGANPGASQTQIEDGVTGKRDRIREALSRLLAPAPVGGAPELVPRLALGPGAQPDGRYFYPAQHSALSPAPLPGADGGA
jgi:hypothetical protein